MLLNMTFRIKKLKKPLKETAQRQTLRHGPLYELRAEGRTDDWQNF